MPQLADKHWIQTLSAYYHSMLLSAVKALAEIYITEERFEAVEQICAMGLKYDATDEKLHCYRITALMRQNKQKLAMECYEQAVKVLHDTLGVRNSEELQNIYAELLERSKGSEAEALEHIYADMQEKEEPEGAYICGYPIFQAIYRLEARKASRVGGGLYVMLLTLHRTDEASCKQQINHFLYHQGMNHIEQVLKQALRIGDVAARYSDTQYVVLLPIDTLEECQKVFERIKERFLEKHKSGRIQIKVDFEEVTKTSLWIK